MTSPIGKIFELNDGSFLLVTSFSSKLNSVDEEMELCCGPMMNPDYPDTGVYNGWEYSHRLPDSSAGYVPIMVRKALESFKGI